MTDEILSKEEYRKVYDRCFHRLYRKNRAVNPDELEREVQMELQKPRTEIVKEEQREKSNTGKESDIVKPDAILEAFNERNKSLNRPDRESHIVFNYNRDEIVNDQRCLSCGKLRTFCECGLRQKFDNEQCWAWW